MSRENVELVRRMYDAYLSGDTEAALSYFHPDVEVDFSAARVDRPAARGVQALDEVVGTWRATWEAYREEVEEIRDLGDNVCLIAMQRGRGKGSGVELESPFASLYEVHDGQITRIRMYRDLKSALEAAESSETP